MVELTGTHDLAVADPAATRWVEPDLLGLRVDAAGRGLLAIDEPLLNLSGTLWGGAGLAATLAFGECVLERPALWMTIQYVGPVRSGELLELTVEPGRRGRGMSQAVIRGSVGDRLAVLAVGTFGGGGDGPLGDSAAAVAGVAGVAASDVDGDVDGDGDDAWRMVAPPAGIIFPDDTSASGSQRRGRAAAGGMLARVEQHWALPSRGQPGQRGPVEGVRDGHAAIWLRLRSGEPQPHTAASLAVLADFAPIAATVTLGQPAHVASLDNSIRIARDLPTEPSDGWVLLETRVEAFVRGVTQLQARLFDSGGRLLATAGQSAALRLPRQP
ncbi:Thioesterase family protein [Frankia sp. AiPs1]|uniref:acyl-CoA thioesterase domain-containing protein n=1 Tax=Frankia sp. AiPa1 TaxID=573492 RepID=UPI00202B2B36|nr:acyl-CoA thioesterase domain-containing protein [Frankia sp. AiPa1]MCL9762719.1 thioesterase family protein [Frankia sp. AiPa1]